MVRSFLNSIVLNLIDKKIWFLLSVQTISCISDIVAAREQNHSKIFQINQKS